MQWGRPPDHLMEPKGREELVERFQSQLGSRKRLHHRELSRTTFWTFRNMLPFGLHIPLDITMIQCISLDLYTLYK